VTVGDAVTEGVTVKVEDLVPVMEEERVTVGVGEKGVLDAVTAPVGDTEAVREGVTVLEPVIVLDAERDPVADRVLERLPDRVTDGVFVENVVPVPETEPEPELVPDRVPEGVPLIVCVGDRLGVGPAEPERVAVMDFVVESEGVIEGVTVVLPDREPVSVSVVEPV
jgi:hypothetical protein